MTLQLSQEKQMENPSSDLDEIIELSSGEEWKIDEVNSEEITLKIQSHKFNDKESDPEFDLKNPEKDILDKDEEEDSVVEI